MTLPRPDESQGDTVSFGEELVAGLRREGFSRESLRVFFSSAYERSRDEVYSNPDLARSTLGWGLVFFAALFVYSAGLSFLHDHELAIRSLTAGSIWLALSCVWLLAHFGLARDKAGRRMERVNVPTLLTLLRSVLAPLIVVSAVSGHSVLAGVLFAAGGISDILDGVIARRLGQTTRLGVVMDHLVDVVFIAATFLSFAVAGLLSPWVGLLVGVRYGLVLIGGACICLFKGPVKIKPTTFGRFSGVILYLMALIQIAVTAYGPPVFAGRLSELLHVGFVILFAATILQAIIIGWYNLKRNSAGAAGGKIAGDVRWR
jgi:phosphatidylglycerophosphate synthase